jgi:hypothetical protein
MTPEWLKQLYKASDLVLTIPVGAGDYWPNDLFEPLILGLIFPFINRHPWQLQGTPKMFAMARQMRGLFEEKDLVAAGNILRKFLLECKGLHAVSQDVVRGVLYFESQSGVSCPHVRWATSRVKTKETQGIRRG